MPRGLRDARGRVTVCDTRPAGSCQVSVTREPEGLRLGVACVAVEAATLLRASALAPPPDTETPPRVTATALPPARRAAGTARVSAGGALAPEMGDSTSALLVDARWFVSPPRTRAARGDAP